MISCNVNKNLIVRWLIVCICLLVSPYTLLVLVPVFIILFYKKIYNKFDLLLLYFLSFLIFNTLVTLGTLGNIRFLLIFVCILDVFLGKKELKKGKKPLLGILIFCFLIYILLNTIFVSSITDYSFLQFLQFVILLLFTFISTSFKTLKEFKYIYENIFNLYIVVLGLSLLALAIPSISFARNGTGFQGITLHPNAYGIFFSAFTALTFVMYIYKNKILYILLFILSLTSVFLSQSRTSLLSILLGLLIYFLITPEFRKKMSRTTLIALPVICLLLISMYDKISEFIYSFLLKGGNGSIIESVEKSRGTLIDAQIKNIQENTFFGIGFKVPSLKSLKIIEDLETIQYEKGNFFLACVEELGVLGFIFFISIIIYLLLNRYKYDKVFSIIPLTLFVTVLGESTLFSIGGLGVFIWAMMFLNRKNNYKSI